MWRSLTAFAVDDPEPHLESAASDRRRAAAWIVHAHQRGLLLRRRPDACQRSGGRGVVHSNINDRTAGVSEVAISEIVSEIASDGSEV